ncbi:YgaP family membrane protein [Halalkalibacterium ligniniphilum]|uniref:YgaP family membrane protein n=1 Tax=Halalkalibacterium ligniniphilum TaxID=1134413 RepID=UPI00036A9B3E|nr:DUF2892 domain-containing protein [Halalkalibacterium ligniniphilum]
MNQNIGRIDALCRITMGFTALAWATAKLSHRTPQLMHLICAMMGAMKVAEGITRFCPLVFIIEERTNCRSQEQQEDKAVNPS